MSICNFYKSLLLKKVQVGAETWTLNKKILVEFSDYFFIYDIRENK